MPSIVITPNNGTVLTAADVAQHLAIEDEAHYPYLEAVLIPAVVAMFESHTRCRLLSTTMEDVLPGWPRTGRIDLAWGPVASVVSVQYLDAAGAPQVLPGSAYQASADGSVYAAPWVSQPPMAEHPSALRVRYVAGFGADAAAVPRNVRLWLLAHAGDLFERRQAHAEARVERLPYIDNLIADYCRPTI